MNSYPFGSAVLLTGEFADASNVLMDPTVITLRVRDPSGTMTSYTGVAITRTSTGMFSCQVVPATSGIWKYRWEGTGAAIAAGEKRFEIQPSDFGGGTELT